MCGAEPVSTNTTPRAIVAEVCWCTLRSRTQRRTTRQSCPSLELSAFGVDASSTVLSSTFCERKRRCELASVLPTDVDALPRQRTRFGRWSYVARAPHLTPHRVAAPSRSASGFCLWCTARQAVKEERRNHREGFAPKAKAGRCHGARARAWGDRRHLLRVEGLCSQLGAPRPTQDTYRSGLGVLGGGTPVGVDHAGSPLAAHNICHRNLNSSFPRSRRVSDSQLLLQSRRPTKRSTSRKRVSSAHARATLCLTDIGDAQGQLRSISLVCRPPRATARDHTHVMGPLSLLAELTSPSRARFGALLSTLPGSMALAEYVAAHGRCCVCAHYHFCIAPPLERRMCGRCGAWLVGGDLAPNSGDKAQQVPHVMDGVLRVRLPSSSPVGSYVAGGRRARGLVAGPGNSTCSKLRPQNLWRPWLELAGRVSLFWLRLWL